MYQNIDRSNVYDSVFHMLALEAINYILNKNIETKAKLTEIDSLGLHFGERIANHLLNNNFSSGTKMEQDEVLKFLGRDVWLFVFGKQITKLQTNRKGIFLIDSEEIKFHQFLLTDKNGGDNLDTILAFVSGMIKGVLSAFNVESTVTASFKTGPILNTILTNGLNKTNTTQSTGTQVVANSSYSFTINLSI